MRRFLVFAVRSLRTGTAEFLNEVQKAVWSLNPDLPMANLRTQEAIASKSMAPYVIHPGDAGAGGRDGHAAGSRANLRSHLMFGTAADAGDRHPAGPWAPGSRQ